VGWGIKGGGGGGVEGEECSGGDLLKKK